MTIASGSKITINSTDGIYFSTVGQIYYSGSVLFINTSGANTITLYAPNDVLINSDTQVRVGSDFFPTSTSYNCGTSTAYWANVYATEVNYSTLDAGPPWDDFDDFELIRSIKVKTAPDGSLERNKKGFPMWDVKTFPAGFTNLGEVHNLINKKYGLQITENDVIEILDSKKTMAINDNDILDSEMVGHHIFTKGARTLSYLISLGKRLVETVDTVTTELEKLKKGGVN